jgi:hypothetical protein
MTTHAVLPQGTVGKVPSKPVSPPMPSPKAAPEARPSVYWGDRLTIWFWIFCFLLMMAMNLFEAVHRFVLYLVGISPS